MADNSALTPKSRTFCEEYLKDLNGAGAAVRAGYSAATSNTIAAQLLAKPEIREYLSDCINRRIHRTQIDADFVLNTLLVTIQRGMACAPVVDMFGKQVFMQHPDDPEAHAAVFRYDPKTVQKGLELLGKHLKLFTDVTETHHSFSQMPTVEIETNANTGNKRMKLTFDVGSEPEKPSNGR